MRDRFRGRAHLQPRDSAGAPRRCVDADVPGADGIRVDGVVLGSCPGRTSNGATPRSSVSADFRIPSGSSTRTSAPASGRSPAKTRTHGSVRGGAVERTSRQGTSRPWARCWTSSPPQTTAASHRGRRSCTCGRTRFTPSSRLEAGVADGFASTSVSPSGPSTTRFRLNRNAILNQPDGRTTSTGDLAHRPARSSARAPRRMRGML